jgi:hypothetical protein
VPYQPITVEVYLAAQSALAGFYSGQFVDQAAWYAELADAWGQAIDQAWGHNTFTTLDLAQIGTCSLARLTADSAPRGLDPEAYADAASEIVALVRAGTARVVAQGIDPNSVGLVGVQQVPFDYTSGMITVLAPVTTITILLHAVVIISEAFNGPGASLSLGSSADPAVAFAPGDAVLSKAGTYDALHCAAGFASNDLLLLTLSLAGSTQGKGLLVYELE